MTARKDGQKKKRRQFVVRVETAQKIVDVCRQIEKCQRALVLVEKEENGRRFLLLTSWNSNNDSNDSFELSLFSASAKGVLQAEIAKLQADYEALNNEAIKEANQK
jgi:hypothetical protein